MVCCVKSGDSQIAGDMGKLISLALVICNHI